MEEIERTLAAFKKTNPNKNGVNTNVNYNQSAATVASNQSADECEDNTHESTYKRFKTSFDEEGCTNFVWATKVERGTADTSIPTKQNSDESAATTECSNSPTDPINSGNIFEDSDDTIDRKKRTQKMHDKETKAAAEEICKVCDLFFAKVKRSTGMCHNCHKVFKQATQVALQCDANAQPLEFIESTKEIRVTCGNRHTWTVPFKVKNVKFWCGQCDRSERDRRKAYHREFDAERQRELREMQAQMMR